MSSIIRIDRESAVKQAASLFTEIQTPNIDKLVSLPKNEPYFLRYTTDRYFKGEENTSYARIALVNFNANLPEIGDYQDALQTPVAGHEIALRDFTLDHYPSDKIAKVYSGLHVRKEVTDQGIGGLLIGLSNKIIEDMILRFLTASSIEQVIAFILAASHSNGTKFNRVGWTFYQASKLGYRPLDDDSEIIRMRKEYNVDQILRDHVGVLPALSTPYPHRPI